VSFLGSVPDLSPSLNHASRTTPGFGTRRNHFYSPPDGLNYSSAAHSNHRTIGDVILPDGMNLNQELVRHGWCWWYRKYAPGDTVLEGLEKDAREAQKGLWVDAAPIPP
jgi:Staphylococcal nuclease homologue